MAHAGGSLGLARSGLSRRGGGAPRASRRLWPGGFDGDSPPVNDQRASEPLLAGFALGFPCRKPAVDHGIVEVVEGFGGLRLVQFVQWIFHAHNQAAIASWRSRRSVSR